jgi:L-threonylcarbamoyladenylate synthase
MAAQILCAEGAGRDISLQAVCEELARGGIAALPTETVYGLAGDALNDAAAARIFEAKERPFFDPLICHLPGLDWLDQITAVPLALQPLVARLAAAFWPGPLTLVLPKRACIPDLVSSGLPTVAVRWSAHPLFQEVLTRFNRPLAAPSANRFGRISPTTAAHVLAELGDRIPFILEGGPTLHGLESTIVAPTERGIRILRSGPVTSEQLETYASVLESEGTPAGESPPEAPGQLKSHYAPHTPLFLCATGETPPPARQAGLLAWRNGRSGFGALEVLSPSGEPREAAARLFAALRRLDEAGLERIHAELVPHTGLGIAINDRLQRAAAR